MLLYKHYYNLLKWITRIYALLLSLFGLPFYFGYGNILPLFKPERSLWDNIWSLVFPFMFTGLLLGLKFPKAGGFIVTIPLLIGFILGYIDSHDIPWPMLFPFVGGVLYLMDGYLHKNNC